MCRGTIIALALLAGFAGLVHRSVVLHSRYLDRLTSQWTVGTRLLPALVARDLRLASADHSRYVYPSSPCS